MAKRHIWVVHIKKGAESDRSQRRKYRTVSGTGRVPGKGPEGLFPGHKRWFMVAVIHWIFLTTATPGCARPLWGIDAIFMSVVPGIKFGGGHCHVPPETKKVKEDISIVDRKTMENLDPHLRSYLWIKFWKLSALEVAFLVVHSRFCYVEISRTLNTYVENY